MVESTWVLVADCSRARIFLDAPHGLLEIMAFVHPVAREHIRAMVSDRSGQRWANGSTTGSSPGPDPRAAKARRFALHLSNVLRRGLTDQVYDRLVLVAPPHFLGLLRQCLDPQVAKRVVSSIDHDFTAHRADEISERIHAPKKA